VAGDAASLLYRLEPGQSLNAAVTQPLLAAGMQCAAIEITGGAFSPFAYVIPALPQDADHVAYFSKPHTPAGITRLDFATATFGWRDGSPFLHCHGSWAQTDGRRRGGHILPHETIIVAAAEVRAFAMPEVRIEAAPDAETNFTLFAPVAGGPGRGRMIVARIHPNEDICTALEAICRTHNVREAVVRGSLGSLIGARFQDGRSIDDVATEVFVRHGFVRNGQAELELGVVDMAGKVHQGALVQGENPVCITFELMLEKLA
jgi:predicted DNA-binding protein with PD1-like motif